MKQYKIMYNRLYMIIKMIRKIGSTNAENNKEYNVNVIPNVHSAENIYYYAFFKNTTNKDISAFYIENRSQPVLDKISDYKMAVLSVDFSDIDIPYFISDEIDLTFKLEYLPESLSSTITLFAGVPTNIFTYQQLINEYNIQLLNAFNNIKTAYDFIHGVGAWVANILLPQVAPGITFDAINNLFTLYVDQRMSETSNTIYWYSQIQFLRLFQGTNSIESNNLLQSRFIFQATYLNQNIITVGLINYIQNVQQYSSGSNWSLLSEIVLVSRSITCRKQFIGSSPSDSQALLNSVIENYPVNIDNKFRNPSSRFTVWNIVGTPRWIDLYGDNSLYQIDFALYYTTSTGRYQLLTIKPSQDFGIKVMFVKQIF